MLFLIGARSKTQKLPHLPKRKDSFLHLSSCLKKSPTVFVTIFSYICNMSRKEKLIARFLQMPRNFHFDEMSRLLKDQGFESVKKGKTSGSRVKFEHKSGKMILLHKPHPSGIMKMYQLKQVKEILDL